MQQLATDVMVALQEIARGEQPTGTLRTSADVINLRSSDGDSDAAIDGLNNEGIIKLDFVGEGEVALKQALESKPDLKDCICIQVSS